MSIACVGPPEVFPPAQFIQSPHCVDPAGGLFGVQRRGATTDASAGTRTTRHLSQPLSMESVTTTGQTVRVRTVPAQLDPALPGLGLALHILAALPLRGSETGWMPVCRSSGLAGLACGRIQRGANLPHTLAWRRAWQTRSNALQALLVHNSKQPWVFSIDAGQPLPVILARSLAPSRLSVSRITRRAQPPDARSPEPIA